MTSPGNKVPSGLPLPLALVFLITTGVALLAIDARATYGARVSADEPQYLLTALSLAEDFDLDIADELAEERYRPFHETSLNPQTIALNDSGQRLSPHDPLLPVILAPAVAVGGWVGAKVMLAILTGCTAVLTAWTAVRRLDVAAGPAIWVTGAFFVAPPLTSYGSQVYPEMGAALATIIGFSALLGRVGRGDGIDGAPRRSSENRLDMAVVSAVVALPWLSVKYVPVAAVLAVGLLLVTGRSGRTRRAVLQTATFFAAGIGYLLLHQRIYGGWTVYAAGDHFVDGEFQVVGTNPDYAGRSRRLLGLLVDHRFGLIAWNPAYLGLPAALGAVARRSTTGGRAGPGRLLIPAVLSTGWAVATWVALTMHGWWWPGRQVVVVLPVAVLAMTVLADRFRGATTALVSLSAVGTAGWLWLIVEASTGRRTLIVDFFETGAPSYRLLRGLLPDHAAFAVGDQVITALWAVAMIGGGIAIHRWGRTNARTTADHVPEISGQQFDNGDVRIGDQPATTVAAESGQRSSTTGT